MQTFENVFLSGFLQKRELSIDFKGRRVLPTGLLQPWDITAARLALLRTRSIAGMGPVKPVMEKQTSAVRFDSAWPKVVVENSAYI